MGFNILVTHWFSAHLPHFYPGSVRDLKNLPSLNSPFEVLDPLLTCIEGLPSLPVSPRQPSGQNCLAEKKKAPWKFNRFPPGISGYWGGKIHQESPYNPWFFFPYRNSLPLKILCFECQLGGGFKFCFKYGVLFFTPRIGEDSHFD